MNHWKIRILEVHPGTLRTEDAYVVRVFAGHETAWDLGDQVWRTWQRQNPGKLSQLFMSAVQPPQD